MPRKASARLLYSTISTSERVAGLGVNGALVFTWLLAHADHQGRYAGTAKKVKAEVVPMIEDITVEDVEKALADMETAKLIIRYHDDKYGPLLQIIDWWEFQRGLKVHHPSRYPAPEGWQDRVTEPLPRGSGGRFTSNLKGNILDFLRNEEASLDEICWAVTRPREEIAEALEELCLDGTVEVLPDEYGERGKPPFKDHTLFGLSS